MALSITKNGSATGRLSVAVNGGITSRLSLPGDTVNWTMVMKSSDESIIDDDVLGDDAVLKWICPAGINQAFRGRVLFYCSNASADFKFAMAYTGAPGRWVTANHAIANGATAFSNIEVETTGGGSNSVAGTGNYGCVWVEGFIENPDDGSGASTVSFQWAQNTIGIGPDTTTVLAGSFFEYIAF